MASTDKRKQSLYFAEDMLKEIMLEANRLDRSLSWVMQCAWRMASTVIHKFPPVDQSVASSESGPKAPPDAWLAKAPEAEAEAETETETSSLPEPQADPQVREFLKGKFENTPAMTQG